jgi:hypothetical protein
LDDSFNNYLSLNGFGSEADSENENRIPAAHRYSV